MKIEMFNNANGWMGRRKNGIAIKTFETKHFKSVKSLQEGKIMVHLVPEGPIVWKGNKLKILFHSTASR